MLTAPTNDAGGTSSGRCYVYSGATGDELYKVTGASGTWLGHDANACGDMDGLGQPDLLAGAPRNADVPPQRAAMAAVD